jgi:hypothetical protein
MKHKCPFCGNLRGITNRTECECNASTAIKLDYLPDITSYNSEKWLNRLIKLKAFL